MEKFENGVGGSNNIPRSEPKTPFDFIQDNYDPGCDKEICFDWISFTFTDISYTNIYDSKIGLGNILHDEVNDVVMHKILDLMDEPGCPWRTKELHPFGHNGYKYGIIVGEFIQINFQGPPSNGRPTTQILMKGEGCNEFIENRNGKWYDFFYYLRNELHGHFRRVDVAIDDYTGKECNIYELESYALNLQFTGQFRIAKVVHKVKKKGNSKLNLGYSITYGAPSSTQLQQYDKNLERKSKKQRTRDTEVWYRHEMRIVGEKADNVIDVFLASQMVSDDPSIQQYIPEFDFVKFAFGLLANMIMFKAEEGSDLRHLYREDNLPMWLDFLGNYQNVDIHTNGQRKHTWNQKKIWNERSMSGQQAMFIAVLGYDDYVKDQLFHIGVAMTKLTDVQKEVINKKLESEGRRRLDDVGFYNLANRYIAQSQGKTNEYGLTDDEMPF